MGDESEDARGTQDDKARIHGTEVAHQRVRGATVQM